MFGADGHIISDDASHAHYTLGEYDAEMGIESDSLEAANRLLIVSQLSEGFDLVWRFLVDDLPCIYDRLAYARLELRVPTAVHRREVFHLH